MLKALDSVVALSRNFDNGDIYDSVKRFLESPIRGVKPLLVTDPGVAAAGLAGLVAMAFVAIAPALASDLFAAAIETIARVAIPATDLLALAQQPTVPVAAIGALAVAIVHEYAQRREPVREVTS